MCRISFVKFRYCISSGFLRKGLFVTYKVFKLEKTYTLALFSFSSVDFTANVLFTFN